MPTTVGMKAVPRPVSARALRSALDMFLCLPPGWVSSTLTGPLPGPLSSVKALVVVPDAQSVVGALLPKPARNRLLAAHGIQGREAALPAPPAQPFRGGRARVGRVVHGRLVRD